MTLKELQEAFFNTAHEFGASWEKETGNAVKRDDHNSEDKPYFALIREGETPTGSYGDFSLVVFPNIRELDGEVGPCMVTLGVGSEKFKNDTADAMRPGWRRNFQRLVENEKQALDEAFANGSLPEQKWYVKTDFTDFTNQATKEFFAPLGKKSKVRDVYGKVIQAAIWIDPSENESQSLTFLKQWIAQYATLRHWGTQAQQTAARKLLPSSVLNVNVKQEVEDLLKKERYVVLQGAPGVGKTYTAREIAAGYKNVFFVQFHASTSYSDFVWGIRPDLSGTTLNYKAKEGVLYQAIKEAKDHPEERVLLIIDEINRANLANVLGPVFYLFERDRDSQLDDFTVEVAPGLVITEMPGNLHVLATMNTADRSLAVVDFALRRRFRWYTIRPAHIPDTSTRRFLKTYFDEMAAIFESYATDMELDLQPGPSYFLVDTSKPEEEFRSRCKYELLPLIKEYLDQGFFPEAKEAFQQFFAQKGIELEMYR